METIDRMTFDGSCDPNPGGRMGWSYIITFADGRVVQQHNEEARNPANTVNVAEYRGLRDGLRAYLAAGGRGPLWVIGDSQLIIYQVNGTYKVKKPELKPYHAEIMTLLPQIRNVSITWNRREHNTAADRLARGEQALAAGGTPDDTDLYLSDTLQSQLPPDVTAAIAQLNRNPAPGFRAFAGLRTRGMDAFSTIPISTLAERAGSAAVLLVKQALPDEKAQATALRWALRGLGVKRAIRKVQVDAEISAQSQRQGASAKGARFRR